MIRPTCTLPTTARKELTTASLSTWICQPFLQSYKLVKPDKKLGRRSANDLIMKCVMEKVKLYQTLGFPTQAQEFLEDFSATLGSSKRNHASLLTHRPRVLYHTIRMLPKYSNPTMLDTARFCSPELRKLRVATILACEFLLLLGHN